MLEAGPAAERLGSALPPSDSPLPTRLPIGPEAAGFLSVCSLNVAARFMVLSTQYAVSSQNPHAKALRRKGKRISPRLCVLCLWPDSCPSSFISHPSSFIPHRSSQHPLRVIPSRVSDRHLHADVIGPNRAQQETGQIQRAGVGFFRRPTELACEVPVKGRPARIDRLTVAWRQAGGAGRPSQFFKSCRPLASSSFSRTSFSFASPSR